MHAPNARNEDFAAFAQHISMALRQLRLARRQFLFAVMVVVAADVSAFACCCIAWNHGEGTPWFWASLSFTTSCALIGWVATGTLHDKLSGPELYLSRLNATLHSCMWLALPCEHRGRGARVTNGSLAAGNLRFDAQHVQLMVLTNSNLGDCVARSTG